MTLMVMSLVMAISTTVAFVTINDLRGSSQARNGGVALNAAEAGISHALGYMRSSGVRGLCPPKATEDSPEPAGCLFSKGAPVVVDDLAHVPGSEYSVWIRSIEKFTINGVGDYVVHSTGEGPGGASRVVKARVRVESSAVPRGIYAAEGVEPGGTAGVHNQSIFTTGCVYKRSRLNVSGTDLIYDIPAAVHSSQYITDNQSSHACSEVTSIHSPAKNSTVDRDCNTTKTAGLNLRFDQDRAGGPLAGTVCADDLAAYAGAATYYSDALSVSDHPDPEIEGSKVRDDQALFDVFGIKQPALDRAQLDSLRSIADAQDNLHDSASWDPLSLTEDHAVLYFDLTDALPNERDVNLNDIPAKYQRPPLTGPVTTTNCPNRSLIVVVEDGNASLNGGNDVSGAVFLVSEDGRYGNLNKGAGTGQFTGTIYGNVLDLTGTTDIWMDNCFLANFSPALMDVSVQFYLEDDSGTD